MIVVTTLKGERLAINDELIERVEDDRPTRVILTNGTCYMVAESVEDVVLRCQEGRAAVQALALQRAVSQGAHHGAPDPQTPFADRAGARRQRAGDHAGATGATRAGDENIVHIDRFTAPPDGAR